MARNTPPENVFAIPRYYGLSLNRLNFIGTYPLPIVMKKIKTVKIILT